MNMDDTQIDNVSKLLALHDYSFVRMAYILILGREPDLAGEEYYLARLRTGTQKLEIIKQLRRSPEGINAIQSVAGVDRVIKRHRLAGIPILGRLFRLLWNMEGNGAIHRALRMIGNEAGFIRSELARFRLEQATLFETVRELAAPPIAAPNVAVLPLPTDLEPEAQAADSLVPAALDLEPIDAGLGRHASHFFSLLASNMQKQQTKGAD